MLPRLPFKAMKEAALGKAYELTVTIISASEIRALNKAYRNIDEPTDILSFPLSKTEGEIYICPAMTRLEAKKFERDYENFFAFLFIHGCTHLKGYEHGDTMERQEIKIRKQFNV